MGKSCFIISPIGGPNTDVRRRADCLLRYIVKPAFEQLGFDTIERVDEADDPGQITVAIIQRLYRADWVVADLSGLNPNVFYELGIRHPVQKPIIHLTSDISSIPFDNANQNTILYVHDDPVSHDSAKSRIISQVQKADKEGKPPSTPVSVALGHLELKETGDSKDQLLYWLVQRLAHVEDVQLRQQQEFEMRENYLLNPRNALSGFLPTRGLLSTDESGESMGDILKNALTDTDIKSSSK